MKNNACDGQLFKAPNLSKSCNKSEIINCPVKGGKK